MSPRMKEFTERINVFFTPEQLEKIKEKTDRLETSVFAYVHMIVLREVNNG